MFKSNDNQNIIFLLGRYVFSEDEEDDNKNGDLLKFVGTKSYLASICQETKLANYEQVNSFYDFTSEFSDAFLVLFYLVC